MKESNRPVSIHLKLFTGAYPERTIIQIKPGSRIRDLMAKVKKESLGRVRGKNIPLSLQDMGQDELLLILNGRAVQDLQGDDTPLENGDVLAVFPVMAGG